MNEWMGETGGEEKRQYKRSSWFVNSEEKELEGEPNETSLTIELKRISAMASTRYKDIFTIDWEVEDEENSKQQHIQEYIYIYIHAYIHACIHDIYIYPNPNPNPKIYIYQ